MSLSEQTSRVANGGKNTLKAILEKMGATVPSTTKIDGYPALAAGVDNMAISAATKALYGLGSDAVPDDVLQAIVSLLFSNKYGFRVPVRLSDGTNAVGIPVVGLVDLNTGEFAVTGPDGIAIGYTTTATPTFSVRTYLDIASSTTVQATGTEGTIVQTDQITLTTRNFLEITASTTGMFSAAMTRLDMSVVSGGAGGGSGMIRSNNLRAGSGGNVGTASGGTGGYARKGGGGGGGGGGASAAVVTQEDVSFTPDTEYSFIVGAGGEGGHYSSGADNGEDGGTSSALGITDNGLDGYNGSSGSYESASTTRSGNGGDARTSSTQIYASFTTMKSVGVGGSGSDGTTGLTESEPGGDGGFPGGGGGGSGGTERTASIGDGGNGADGEITMRMWHGEEAA